MKEGFSYSQEDYAPYFKTQTPLFAIHIQLRAALYPDFPRIKTIGVPGGEHCYAETPQEFAEENAGFLPTAVWYLLCCSGTLMLACVRIARQRKIIYMMLRWIHLGVIFDPEIEFDPINLNQGRDFFIRR